MSQVPDPGEYESLQRQEDELQDPRRQQVVPVDDKVDAVREESFREMALQDQGPRGTPLGQYGEFILAAWPDDVAADTFMKSNNMKGLKDLAIVKRDEEGKLHIYDRDEHGLGRGAVVGGAVGGAIGLLFGPLALATAAVGAVIGGAVEKMTDSGFADDKLKAIGGSLGADSSVLVAIADFEIADQFKADLAASGAELYSALGTNTLAALTKLHDEQRGASQA